MDNNNITITPETNNHHDFIIDEYNVNNNNKNDNKDEDDDDNSSETSQESYDSCLALIEFESIRNKEELEEAITVSWDFKSGDDDDDDDENCGTENNDIEQKDQKMQRRRKLTLSTTLEPDDIAPLFSGAEWAGTRIWHAAIRAISYMEQNYHQSFKQRTTPPPSLIELGCGLGVPGMILHMMGARAILTDQPSLLSQLRRNIDANFGTTTAEDDGRRRRRQEQKQGHDLLRAESLSWSREGISELMMRCNDGKGFDFVLHCDCVYEPLYGESWKELVEVIDEVLARNKDCVVVNSMERRVADGVDKFLAAMEQCETVERVDLVYRDEKNDIEIYLTRGVGAKG